MTRGMTNPNAGKTPIALWWNNDQQAWNAASAAWSKTEASFKFDKPEYLSKTAEAMAEYIGSIAGPKTVVIIGEPRSFEVKRAFAAYRAREFALELARER